jgi:hypothetical protein
MGMSTSRSPESWVEVVVARIRFGFASFVGSGVGGTAVGGISVGWTGGSVAGTDVGVAAGAQALSTMANIRIKAISRFRRFIFSPENWY